MSTEDLGIAYVIQDYLAENGIIAIPGDSNPLDIDVLSYIGELPLEINNCLSIIYAPSPAPNPSLDVYRQSLDFWSRNQDVQTAYNVLVQLLDLLHKKTNYKLPGFHIYFSLAQSMIQDMDRDEEKRQLYKVSMDFMYRRDLTVS